jgi:hypothetical protein
MRWKDGWSCSSRTTPGAFSPGPSLRKRRKEIEIKRFTTETQRAQRATEKRFFIFGALAPKIKFFLCESLCPLCLCGKIF